MAAGWRSSRRGGPATARSRRPRRGAPRRTGGSSPTAGSGSRARVPRPRPATAPPGWPAARSTVVGIDTLPAADRLGGFQGAAAGEHRQPAQQHLFGLGQQLERPVDRRPQRLVMCRAAPPAGKYSRNCAPAAGPARPASSRRTRAAASSIASAIPSRRRTTAATAAAFSAVTAKSGLTAAARSANSRTASAWVIAARSASAPGTSQRRHRNQPLPLDPQALTAGRQDHQPLARPRQDPGQRCRPFEEMLAVIQHQQQLLAAQELHQRPAVLWPAGRSPRTPRRPHRPPRPGRGPVPARTATRRHRTAATPARRPATPAGSCPPRPARSGSPPAPRPARPRSAPAPARGR